MAESGDLEISVSEGPPMISNDSTDSTADANEITMILAGKSGAGKSTLLQTLLGLERDIELSAGPDTKQAEHQSIERNNIKINIICTSGAVGKDKNFDLLVYCVTISPGSRFQDANPALMRNLQDTYGKNIWKHCVIVFTFSNVALERSKKGGTEDRGIEHYKQYIEEYAKSFQEELHAKSILYDVKTIFSQSPGHPSDSNIIMAIPAGDEPEDPVLPGVELHNDSKGWVDEIFFEMIKKCKSSDKLAQYHCRQENPISKIPWTGGDDNGSTGVGSGTAERGHAGTEAVVTRHPFNNFWILCWRCCYRNCYSGCGKWRISNRSM